jgi:amino-acid N-acetyltransferase
MKPAARLATRPASRALPRVRAARLRAVPALEAFIARFTGDGTLLPRTRANLVQHVRDFRVVYEAGELIGCGALQLVDGRLAEIRSIVVHPSWRGAGIGGRILEGLLRDARRLGVGRVFCLTRRQRFFAHHDFVVVPMERFPHKIWNDCRLCPRRTHCDEIAMERVLAQTSATVPGPGRVLPLHPSPRRSTGHA